MILLTSRGPLRLWEHPWNVPPGLPINSADLFNLLINTPDLAVMKYQPLDRYNPPLVWATVPLLVLAGGKRATAVFYCSLKCQTLNKPTVAPLFSAPPVETLLRVLVNKEISLSAQSLSFVFPASSSLLTHTLTSYSLTNHCAKRQIRDCIRNKNKAIDWFLSG